MLIAITTTIDRISRLASYLAIYLVLAASMVSAFNALARYSVSGLIYLAGPEGGGIFGAIFDLYRSNSNTLSEAQWYMFTGMVMLGGAWTLKVNEHVRVDLLYGSVSEKTRTWIDFLGGVFFLMPMCMIMLYFTWPWFLDAWNTGEGSLNSGGIIRWPVKLMVPVGFALLGLQAIAEIIKCYLALTGSYVLEFAYEKPLQ